jgi:ketosteroid isomerase-like protein
VVSLYNNSYAKFHKALYLICAEKTKSIMNNNELLIQKFYTCFQNKDYKGMQNCYADNAIFSDAVFVNLNAAQVKAMWQMLITRGKDLQLEFKNINADEKSGSAEWTATYTFSATGKKVINHIHADFLFEDGKISKHTDSFNFYTWAKQALGPAGVLLGRTSFFKNKIRKTAIRSLDNFMNNKILQ